jgi:hypothetical protein
MAILRPSPSPMLDVETDWLSDSAMWMMRRSLAGIGSSVTE